jgi:Putative prokaryotic signal transducing protein
LPEEECNMTSDEIVRLGSAGTLQEAHVWQATLDHEGIRCRVVGEFLTQGFGVGVPGMYPELWVYGRDLDRARAALQAHPAGGGRVEP